MGMGLRFEQYRHSDDGICAVGRWDLVKIWAGKFWALTRGSSFGLKFILPRRFLRAFIRPKAKCRQMR